MISDYRISHMHAVAEYMYEHAEEYGLDKEEMYLLGLLHDIGYLKGEKAGHEAYGAKLILKTFPSETAVNYRFAISHHNRVPKKFDWDEGAYRMLFLLLKADMLCTHKIVGYEKRLKGIADSYGEESETYRTCKEITDWLKKNDCVYTEPERRD